MKVRGAVVRTSISGGCGCLIVFLLAGCGGSSRSAPILQENPPPPPPAQTAYFASNLVSDGSLPATKIDPNLINPWGIVFGNGAPVWV